MNDIIQDIKIMKKHFTNLKLSICSFNALIINQKFVDRYQKLNHPK